MTTLEPRLQQCETATLSIATPAPDRLRSWPSPRRPLLREIVDFFAVLVNRSIDSLPLAHALHRRALARLEYTEVPLAVGARADLDGLRIAFLTDLHVGSFLDEATLLGICEDVVRQKPDLICLGGDLVNSRPEEIELLDGPLRALRAPLGVYAVPGNHDHRWIADMGAWQDYLESRGVEVLANRGRRIARGSGSFWLCGVDDLTDGRPDMRRALVGRLPGEPTVMLAHQPDHFPEAAGFGVDLVLSGHTHGGQVKLMGWAPISHTRHGFVDGGFEDNGSRLYVSRGVGTTVLPLRVGTRPEIPFIRLVAARAATSGC
ncbi:MAG: metallophosphoesterase [Planctomycetes bacterium]|nr:metallophosphoesterase [Planctomycetota bacterium]